MLALVDKAKFLLTESKSLKVGIYPYPLIDMSIINLVKPTRVSESNRSKRLRKRNSEEVQVKSLAIYVTSQ